MANANRVLTRLLLCADIDERGLKRYNVLVSDTSTKGNDPYDILCKRNDS